jgi:hypothetical protein
MPTAWPNSTSQWEVIVCSDYWHVRRDNETRMNAQELIYSWASTSDFSDNQMSLLFDDRKLKIEMIDYLKNNPNRKLTHDLLEKVLSKRREQSEIGSGDNIMYASYLVGLNRFVEDSLLIWRAKNVDFDAFGYIDVQLVVFAGIDKTIDFFDSLATEESTKAVEYLKECREAGDFESIDEYFSDEQLPWWI